MIAVYIYIFKTSQDASGYTLTPTITVISHLIISEIFIYQQMIKIKQFQLQYGLVTGSYCGKKHLIR
jgi:hypothetical protein